ncbi:hypothetical protein [Candidatus Trichorickettsia mobilis]|uniref:hypothetical protein n=1 Tax=Candidatus Trichorickettsia mobilis TaxID=1346319 RepID=UPI00292D1B08|nr:hypothetical protein [Candidatus Trichorickettsia mobilis]
MTKFKQPKTRVFANLLHNTFYRKTVIILVGNKGIFLGAINSNKIIDHKFILTGMQEEPEEYINFLQKFKGYYIFFLLDNNECALHHELVPVFQSIVKANPVEEFIKEHFSEEDIVAYNIYSITTKTSENWAVVLASQTYQPPLSKILSYILENSLKFGGIYFLNLELKTIIDRILQITSNTDCNNNLQIFVSILNASSIKCVVKHHGNIISVKSVDYPADKSWEYVQGIIEHEVSDCLILYKKYINSNELNACVIFLVNKELQLLLQQSVFNAYRIVCLTEQDIFKNSVGDTLLLDSVIVKLFAERKSFLGLNSKIRAVIQLDLVNKWLFKPFIAGVIILILLLMGIKMETQLNQKQMTVLNDKYHKIAWEYRTIKQKYPDIKDVTNLADLYSFDKLLKIPVLTPFDLLKQLLNDLSDSKVHLNKISWQLNDYDNIISPKQSMRVEISMKFINNDSSIIESLSAFNEYMSNLRKRFSGFDISYTRSTDKITNLFGNIVMPVTIIISGSDGSR